jgi:hypothetical protein
MMKPCPVMAVLFCLLSTPLTATQDHKTVAVSFFSQQVDINYHPDFTARLQSPVNEKNLLAFFQQLRPHEAQPLLYSLDRQRQTLGLNDWLYHVLTRASVERIFPGAKPAEHELFCWFLLHHSGFDTRITFYGEQVFLYVYTLDEVFETPMIQDQGRVYVSLSSMRSQTRAAQPAALYMLNHAAQPNGKPFRFYLERLPRLHPQLERRSFAFTYEHERYQLDVDIDLTLIRVMENYPFIAERQYLETPLSPAISGSLLPALRNALEGKTQRQAAEMLATFTRSAFQYMDDKDYFGRSKPMFADEVFFYPYSDCEDRSALFYCLVRALLDLPMIIIAFPDHLTIGVAIDSPCEATISWRNRGYCICDPTGPANSSAIGFLPEEYQGQSYEIIGHYR